jgi:hypothetical protein
VAVETECQTDGAIYGVEVQPDRLEVTVEFGRTIELDEREQQQLIRRAHNVLEMLLAPYWK